MTVPLDAPDIEKTRVTILGRIFGKVQKAADPPAHLQDNLHFEDRVGSRGTDAAYWFPGKVPNYDNPTASGYFPTVDKADDILIHWLRPPGDSNPQQWYDDRNTWAKKQRLEIERQNTYPPKQTTEKPTRMEDNPNTIPPNINRSTVFDSPASYSFTRPYDQDIEHELNGVHLSLADNRRAYLLVGAVGRTDTWNNSYRLDPLSNDAQSIFVGDTVTNDVGTRVLYARENVTPPSSRSYRL